MAPGQLKAPMARRETPAVDCVLDQRAMLGETPFWSEPEQALYWINCEAKPALQRFDPGTGKNRAWAMPERIGALALSESGGVIVALASGVFSCDLVSGQLECLARNAADNLALHEGKCDRQGRFWIGSLDQGPASLGHVTRAVIHRLDGGHLSIIIRGIRVVTNGLAWSPDGRRMYWADSASREIFVADYDVETGTPLNQQLLATVEKSAGIPDGAAIDVDGGYWTALFRGSRLRRYTDQGKVDREVQLPISQPTMLAFGGRDYRTVYLTSTRVRLPPEDDSMNGCLFALDLGVQGLPEPLFRRRPS
jgi:L-arabinonolactonase